MSASRELRAEGLSVHFVGVKAVDEVDITLRHGEIVGLIGPNGAGKTTLVNALTGFQPPTHGRVFVDDVDVTGWAPERVARAGVARTFQAGRLFAELTTFQNVELGALGIGTSRKDAREQASRLLERMNLSARANDKAGALPYGDERRVGILRALAARPAFLLLDEPAAGMNERESDDLRSAIASIRDDFGCGVLVIEHDMRVIMRLCERIHVLDYGKTISVGTAAEIQRDAAVIAAYLGTKSSASARAQHAAPATDAEA